jgi:Spy/CpxP family protein refolding chaperone
MSHRTALFVYAAASFTALVVAGFARAAQAQSVPLRDKLHDPAGALPRGLRPLHGPGRCRPRTGG